MKPILLIFLSSLSFCCSAQTIPPTLIYAAEVKDGSTSRYEIFDATGKRLFDKPVDWAYSNTWSWVFVINQLARQTRAYNWKGELLIDSVEQSMSTYTGLNRVGIKKNGKWGFYDLAGKLRILHKYDEVSHFRDGLAAVKQGPVIFMIDTNGTRVNVPYDPKNNDYSFADSDIDIGMSGSFYSPVYKQVPQNGKFALVNNNNETVIPAEYDEYLQLKENFRQVTVGRNKKYGVVAFGGTIIIPVVYSSVFVLNNYF